MSETEHAFDRAQMSPFGRELFDFAIEVTREQYGLDRRPRPVAVCLFCKGPLYAHELDEPCDDARCPVGDPNAEPAS